MMCHARWACREDGPALLSGQGGPAVRSAGTLNYMAPELLEYQVGKLAHPHAVDIYRCGFSYVDEAF